MLTTQADDSLQVKDMHLYIDQLNSIQHSKNNSKKNGKN